MSHKLRYWRVTIDRRETFEVRHVEARTAEDAEEHALEIYQSSPDARVLDFEIDFVGAEEEE